MRHIRRIADGRPPQRLITNFFRHIVTSPVRCDLLFILIQTENRKIFRKAHRQGQSNIAESYYRKAHVLFLKSFHEIHFPSSSLFYNVIFFSPEKFIDFSSHSS